MARNGRPEKIPHFQTRCYIILVVVCIYHTISAVLLHYITIYHHLYNISVLALMASHGTLVWPPVQPWTDHAADVCIAASFDASSAASEIK